MAVRGYAALNAMLDEPDTRPTLPPARIDPMLGFADGPELARYQMREGAFFLGRIHADHGQSFPAGIHDDRHIFVKAGTRAGKGLTIGIPNALMWPGPLFAIDPKGEIASITALRRARAIDAKGTGTSVRRFIGQRVAVLDPLGQVRGPARAFRVDYNPLSDIDMSKGGGARTIDAIADAIIRPDDGNGRHFTETAQTIIAGLIEAVKLREPPERQTIPHMRSILLAGFDALRGYLEVIETKAGFAREAATLMDEVGADEWGSHRSTLSRNLKWLADPDMQTHLGPGAFSLRRAIVDGWSVFVSLPPDQMSRFASWLRIIVATVIEAKMSLGVYQAKGTTLCLLDEFPLLGKFKPIEESAGYMAGFGLKLVPIIQNIGQVRSIYEKNWETFLGNAGGIIAWGLNDRETEQYVADRLGRLLVTETAQSASSGSGAQFMGAAGWNMSQSSNTARHERPVRFPNEVHEQGARETGRAFVLPASGRPLTVERVPYTAFPAGLYDAPEVIAEWERRHWSGG